MWSTTEMQKYCLDKVVVSGGYGNREPEEIKKIKAHLQTLLKQITAGEKKEPKVLVTNCVKPNAIFKTKAGRPMGVKVTLRKEKAKRMVLLLSKTYPLFLKRLKYNNNTLMIGLDDHKKLKLERYKHNVPEYGLNFAIVFCIKERKSLIKTKKHKLVNGQQCAAIVRQIITDNDAI